MLTFDQYGTEFQRRLVRLCMQDPQTQQIVARFAATGHVRWTCPTAHWAWNILAEREYVSPLMLETEARRLAPDHPARVHATTLATMATDWRDDEYVREQIVEWARQTSFMVAQHASVDAWNKGDREAAYKQMMEFADAVNQLQIGVADRGWFFDEFDSRQSRRRASQSEDVFPSGIEALDRAMGGGGRKGEIEIPVAYSGIGKTFWCVHRGSNACYQYRRVLHFVLEGGRTKTEDRYDARFLNALYSQVKRGDLEADSYNRAMLHQERLRQMLVTRGTGDLRDGWSANCAWVNAEVDFLRQAHGWVPDMIVVDYGDLLAEEGDSEYQRQKVGFRKLKHLSERIDFPGHRGYFVVSPSQAQRPSKGADEKEHVIRPRDIADSYEKVRVADVVLSLNRTVAEKEAGQARVHLAKYRDAEDGETVRVKTDYTRGGFVDLEAGTPPPPAPPIP